MSPPRPESKNPKRKHSIQVAVWCSRKLVAAIDEKASEMQRGRLERIHRSDVIRAVLAEKFGIKDEEDAEDE